MSTNCNLLNIVEVPTIKDPIKASPGFLKKELSDHKLDICGLCGFGCCYCSSNSGNFLRMHREEFADRTEEQLGERVYPVDDPHLMFIWPEILENLETQLDRKPHDWGEGNTLVFSMLTDGFSPHLIKQGITEAALRMVLDRTAFRIRVLTKNAIVGSKKWIQLFADHPDRFVVGLSIGTMNDRWAKRIEKLTPPPTARLRALSRLQDAGISTYGMLCPAFPEVLQDNHLERLVDEIRPELVEHVWAEPFNDRVNWRHIRDCLEPDSFGYEWFTEVYEEGRKDHWSGYATELYVRLRAKAEQNGWLDKLRYLLYEQDITADDAPNFEGLRGVWLQSKPDEDGLSKNPWIAELQQGAPAQ